MGDVWGTGACLRLSNHSYYLTRLGYHQSWREPGCCSNRPKTQGFISWLERTEGWFHPCCSKYLISVKRQILETRVTIIPRTVQRHSTGSKYFHINLSGGKSPSLKELWQAKSKKKTSLFKMADCTQIYSPFLIFLVKN